MSGRSAIFCVIVLLLSMCGCSRQPTETPDVSVPPESALPEETPSPTPADPMDGIYPVAAQADAEQVLEQAYEGLVPQLTFAFLDEELTLQDRSILLQNASNQVLSRRPELKYAYQLECTEGPEGTICSIQYMPYKLGYPDGIPEGAVEIHSLADLAEAADDRLGKEEIPIVIRNPELLVDDMQRVLQQAGYGYVINTLNNDATAILAASGEFETLEQSVERIGEVKDMARTVAEQLLTDDMDDEEKLRAIYGYIVEHTAYDYRYYQDPGAMPFESRTAYGPLAEGTAICGGFSWAFRMLCQEAGIPCWNVTGTGAGEEHMWNCALMGDEYRYFDTTWDAGATDEEQWRYFACTETEMTQNHQWGQGQEELLHALTDTKK